MQKIVKSFKEFDWKSNWKRVTFVVSTCVIAVAIVLQSPQMIDAREIKQFNRDLKNYNVKLQVLGEDEKKIAEFNIAIADNDEKKMYGLMNLSKLPQDQGMLFPFFQKQVVMMWMKNTRIPLDMLFIEDSTIVHIRKNTEPYSLEMISSEKDINRVLEINAGLADKLGIKVGQKIRFID